MGAGTSPHLHSGSSVDGPMVQIILVLRIIPPRRFLRHFFLVIYTYSLYIMHSFAEKAIAAEKEYRERKPKNILTSRSILPLSNVSQMKGR